ncbi:hypothetical protein [Clostridium sp. BJN0001]|uniref:hypothetical protein n=1 Tax=Clostridium sp. BJN0001 TaxID=2930219 RepID=UPI001FD09C28|nr:hypothetical protein [Clostridium sp. BJN0001]
MVTKKFDTIEINDSKINDMDYGIDIDLLIGLDILKALNATINLQDMKLSFK